MRTKFDITFDQFRSNHNFALVLSQSERSTWDLREYTAFPQGFNLASKARSIVQYDRALNGEVMNYMLDGENA